MTAFINILSVLFFFSQNNHLSPYYISSKIMELLFTGEILISDHTNIFSSMIFLCKMFPIYIFIKTFYKCWFFWDHAAPSWLFNKIFFDSNMGMKMLCAFTKLWNGENYVCLLRKDSGRMFFCMLFLTYFLTAFSNISKWFFLI